MSKHTPGPWEADGFKGKPPLLITNRYDVICMFRHHERIKEKDIEANARLIAVTPDLLEAVIKAAIPLEAIYANVHWELAEELKDAVVDAVLAIRKVIAKIEEESP